MENSWLGQIQIKIDEKGRFALPSSSVELFSDKQIVLVASVYQKKPYIELINSDEWAKRKETLNKLPEKDPRAKAYKRFIIGGSSQLTLDKQNRITIPGFQRNYLKLKKEAVIVNVDQKIELWSDELWQEIQGQFMESFEDVTDWVNEFESSEEAAQSPAEEESDELKSAA